MCDRKSFLIGVLTLSAAILTLGHLQMASTARADVSEMADDYQMVTGRTPRGDEALYVFSRQRNMVAIFTWDTGKRSVAVRDVKSLETFMNAP